LVKFASRFDRKVVLIPSSDVFIEFVSEHFEVLSDYFCLQSSLQSKVCKNYLNKREFYLLCDRFGVPYPKTIYLTGSETADYLSDRLRFPVILKPNLIHRWKRYLRGRKVININSKAELEELLGREKELLKDSMLQEVIPGSEDNIYLFKGYFDDTGRLLASFTGRKIRQYPPLFGSGSYAVSCGAKEVKDISVNFLKRAGFKGICGTEFKYDPRDKMFKMIEVNIRPQLWEDLTRVAVREIIWVAYCDLAGLDIPKLPPQRNGVIWTYLMRDIVSGLWHVRRKNCNLTSWLASYVKKLDTDALIDFRDLPLLMRLPGYALREFLTFKVKPLLSVKGWS
jgi:D-aspartate ligase